MKTIAIIGIGKWGKNLVAEFSQYFKIKYCYSKGDKSNIRWIKKNYPLINYASNLDTILDDLEVDGVVIATPIHTHYSLVKKALSHKKHVFVEKPIDTNVKNAKNLLEIAKKNNLTLFVGSIFLYHSILKKLKDISRNEQIKFLYFDLKKFGTFNEKLTFDLLTHYIIITNELVGKPKKIIVYVSKGVITKCDILSLEMKYSNNLECFIVINRVSSTKQRSIIIKTSKNLYQWKDEILFKFNKNQLTYKEFFVPKTSPLKNECKEFLKNMTSVKKNYTDLEKSIDAIYIINKNIK